MSLRVRAVGFGPNDVIGKEMGILRTPLWLDPSMIVLVKVFTRVLPELTTRVGTWVSIWRPFSRVGGLSVFSTVVVALIGARYLVAKRRTHGAAPESLLPEVLERHE